MWFIDYMFYALVDIRDWFNQAYYTVVSWVYPFNYLATPLWYIYSGFSTLCYYFLSFKDWCYTVNSKMVEVLTLWEIGKYFESFIMYATRAYHWVTYAWSHITSTINTWWSSTQQTVLAWIDDAKSWLQAQIDSLELLIADLRVLWYEIADKIPSLTEVIAWFANWWARILSPLTSWWNEKLLDVKSLIQSELKDWFPFYDDLVNLWSGIKEFFVDPLGWLEAKFTDWFLGAE